MIKSFHKLCSSNLASARYCEAAVRKGGLLLHIKNAKQNLFRLSGFQLCPGAHRNAQAKGLESRIPRQ